MTYPVAESWTVSGTLNKNGISFSTGKVYAYHQKNNEFYRLAETGISADGFFSLTYSRDNFQMGDPTLEYPTLQIRVEDYQGNSLWVSNLYKEPNSTLNIGFIDISKSPDQNGDCRIFGSVKNEQGNILAGVKIEIYCLHFVETTSTSSEDPSGYFDEIYLGESYSNTEGKYERRYSSSLLPAGLLLDSKEDYGKDKVSLFAKAFEEKNGTFYHKATEHLVFNGKKEQEITFTFKSQQESFECEYQRLNFLLKVYRNAVISWSSEPQTISKKISAINSFLKSNTTFPLVVGRERINENKVHAYFTAYSMLLQMQKRNLKVFSNIAPKSDSENTWLEAFFALALKEGVSTPYKLTKVKPTVLQKTLFGAVSDGLICPIDTTDVLNLWKELVNGGTLQSDEDETDKSDALTISQLLSLYVKGDLAIETNSSATNSSNEPDATESNVDENISQESGDSESEKDRYPHYVAVEDFSEIGSQDGVTSNENLPQEDDQSEPLVQKTKKQILYENLLEVYYSVGADTEAFIKRLQENVLPEEETASTKSSNPQAEPPSNEVPRLTNQEISRLKAIFDLNDFYEKFAPGVVCTYRYATRKENFKFYKLSDLLYLTDKDWENLVNQIAEEYYILYCSENKETVAENETNQNSKSSALPANFPGNNSDLKKAIYARKLSKLIESWFPQQALLRYLTEYFKDSNWSKVCTELSTSKWENFSLSNTDLDEFIGKNDSYFNIKGIELEPDPYFEASDNDSIEKKKIQQTKEKIQQLQRLYHLTESAEAIAYLIDQGIKSAYQISTTSENEFVARHGNGIGKVSEARQIHRLAQHYMAEASLNIQAYVTSSIEAPADIPEEDEEEDSVQQETLDAMLRQNVALAAIPRALPKANMLRANDESISTNTAKVREATRDTINWAGLFGNINFTKATQGQSILSASAYYMDLLKFLKKNSTSYKKFLQRRPDYLDLQLTKANAEIPMPTIDLGIELLESLIAGPVNDLKKAVPCAHNNPQNKTAAELRAEPFNETTSSISEAASLLLASKVYPFQLPANFYRDKAKKILSNLSLNFYDITCLLNSDNLDNFDCRELRLDKKQRDLFDLIYSNADSDYDTWTLWGLKQKSNKVLFPDKNSYSSGNYIGILRRVAVFLQRTGFTIQDLNEILRNKLFNNVRYKPQDSEFSQLSNINGYEFAPQIVIINDTEVEVEVDWDSFFRKIAVLVHRKNILGWSLSDVLLTFNLTLKKIDVICELVGRYGVTIQEALVLGGGQEPTESFVNSIYHHPGLLLDCGHDAASRRIKVINLLKCGLGLSEDDSLMVYGMVNVGQTTPFLDILLECYRYNLIAKTFAISLQNLDKILKYGVWAENDRHDFEGIRKLSDEWRILSGTSIDAGFYLDLLSTIGEDERRLADEFARNICTSDLGKKPTKDAQESDDAFQNRLKAWTGNLDLLICTEFGLATNQDGELNCDKTLFLEKAAEWEAFCSECVNGTDVPKLSESSYALYVNLLRKVSVYNFTQVYEQGVDLCAVDLNLVDAGYDTIKSLVYANYTTDRLLSGEFDLRKLARYAESNNGELEDTLAVETSVIQQLMTFAFGSESPQLDSTECWMKFTKAYELYSKTHLVVSKLVNLLEEDSSNYAQFVKELEDSVKAHMKDSEWRKFAQEMNDDLRRKKRDALAAYICWDSCRIQENPPEQTSRYPQQFVDENDIYSYYLMDVKMEPDMTISRIVQASASIQLFVQRAELGLEGENVLNNEQRSEWKWMKNYRVWEAARKVFLYPENWIASDLRDDKTPFFEELEERIQEFSDDHSNLEKALYEYLEKVREVSSIEIIGATKEDGGDEGGILYTLHIIGRTQGEPHSYYYRKYKAKAILPGEWTPWERLDVDIPSETVSPAIVNQRLYLLWPQVTMGQRNLEAASEGGPETIEYYARIQICWTSYTGTKWTGTRMSCNVLIDPSTNPLDFSLGDNEKIEDRYNLKTTSSSNGIAVSIIKTAYHYQEYEEIVGTTEVMDGTTKTNKVTKRIYDKTRQYFKRIAIITVNADGSDSLEIFTTDYKPIDDYAPERTKLIHGVFTEAEEFTCGNKGFSYPEDNAVLNYTPGLFRIVATNLSMLKLDKDDESEDLPFFYMDGRRTFFVRAVPKDGNVNSTKKNYKFELLSHSLVDDFYKRYRDGGTKWLYTRETQALPISDSYYYSYSNYNYYFSVYLGYYMAGDWQAWDLGQTIFRYNYWPNKANVDGPYPAPMVDFVWGGANAMYNWELFFYVPMLIAEKMIAEQSYEEALLWLQLVFDPREDYTSYERTKLFINELPKGARYWKFLPFFANKDADKSMLQMLGLPTKRDQLPDRTALSSLVDKWKNDPFNPHLIARYRNVAYQKYVVMKYLDTLIGWGDQEFAKDTTESINLAIQFYLLAAELLGPKNAEAPEPEATSSKTAIDLLEETDSLGNAFIQYENSALIGKDKAKVLNIQTMDERAKRTGNIIESMFYFSVPRNEVLFSYWDKVADRLYKIRNSLNIQGVKRALSLFAPPIDPGLMVKARAMGISVDEILNSTTEKRSIYRFRVIVKLAVDMAKDACQMGRDLLSILEKQDAEQLQVFKAKCDVAVIAESRAVHEMEVKSLETEKVRLEEQKAVKKSTSEKKKMAHLVSKGEETYKKIMDKAAQIQEIAEKVQNIASATFKIPDFKYGSVVNAFGGPRFDIESLGGTKLAENLKSAAESYLARFAQRQLDAAKTKLQAELERRKNEWLVEDEVADAEIEEVEQQEVINEIKTQQVEKKQKSIENEILRSEQVYDVLSEKFTNNDLYIWLEKELGKVFQRYVALLVDVAKMAEKAYHFEIEGKTEFTSVFVKNTYWDNLYKGLLAPERILLDLRRMEKAYLENDEHKTTITEPIVIEANLSPKISEGSCTITISDLNQKISEYNENMRIMDMRIQIICETSVASYTRLYAKLSITKGNLTNRNWATGMSFSDLDKFDISFHGDQYLPFEGASLTDEFSLYLKRDLDADSMVEFANAKVVLFLTYTEKN